MTESTNDSGHSPTEEERDWNELVNAASEHVKKRREASAESGPSPARKGRGTFLAMVAVIFLAVIGWDVYYYAFSGKPSSEFEEVALQASVYLAQQAVETVLEETGSLPATLEEAGGDEEGLSYSVSGDGYTLTARGPRHEFSYRQGGDLTSFEAAFRSLLNGEVRR